MAVSLRFPVWSPLGGAAAAPPRRICATAGKGRRRAETPARDRVIDFGKYRGRMLGSLPSSYLNWVSRNLRAGDTEEWARLADQVLADDVYRDRLEWESAHRLLSGDGAAALRRRSAAADDSPSAALLQVSRRFGWDNDDSDGWSRVDFDLLGTSLGGRIPRLSTAAAPPPPPKTARLRSGPSFSVAPPETAAEEDKREQRRTRQRMKQEERMKELKREMAAPPPGREETAGPFVARPSLRRLLNKIRGRES
ncbi:golgin family A protein [Wolffia australiana]